MKVLLKISLILSLLLAFSSTIKAQNQDTTAFYMSQFKNDLEYIINENPYKGGAISVFKDGQFWSTSYGIKTEGVVVDHKERFIFRSFTKTLLATIIFQLQEEDILDIDDAYVAYTEPVTNVDSTLTLRELLSMKANTCEFVGNSWDIIDQDPSKIYQVREILEQTIPAGDCNTEKEVRYTNTNYMVLGLVMESILGKPGEEIFRERFVVENETAVDTTLYPWIIKDGIFELAPIDIDPSTLNGVWVDDNGTPIDMFGQSLNGVLTAQKYAGSVVGTTEQMLRILNAILTPGLLLSQESLDEMQAFENNYGLGLMSYDLNKYIQENIPMKIIGHFGAGLNSTATFMFPEYGYGISIALNMTRSNQSDVFFDGIYNLIFNFTYLYFCEQSGGCADIGAPNPLRGEIIEFSSEFSGGVTTVEFKNWDDEIDTVRFVLPDGVNIADSTGHHLDINDISINQNTSISWQFDGLEYVATSVILNGVITSSEYSSENADEFLLFQNYPNPFNPSTNISFELPEAGLIQLKVYNLLGQEVASLVDGRMSVGNHSVHFDASGLSSGIYIYRLVTGSHSITRKMLLIK